MKVDDVDIELLKGKLAHTRIGFKLDEVDMVCIFFLFLSSDYVMITMLQTIFFFAPARTHFYKVMIPVCNGAHWWLLVANIRDNRFDVLNSRKDEEKKLTNKVLSQLF
jgi:hypothetical protein